MMLGRFAYSLREATRFRTVLKAIKQSHIWQNVNRIVDVNVAALNRAGMKALVLDFDGVLAHHNAKHPNQEVLHWLQELDRHFQGQIFILSNSPTPRREAFFKAHFARVIFVKAAKKKPYPDGIQTILTEYTLPPKKVIVIDDRLLTGVLASLIAGTEAIYIKKPYQNFLKYPFHEAFFSLLRHLERWYVH